MSWEDRWYNQDEASTGGWGARGGRFFRRLFENPENPIGWSVFMFRAWGIDVRVHLIMLVVILLYLLRSIMTTAWGFGPYAYTMIALFGIVLIHEFGHCFACRAAGGDARRIVLLPWGGLALTLPADGWKAHFITTAGGPFVHLLIFPLTTAALFAAGLGETVLFNPLNPGYTLSSAAFGGSFLIAQQILWSIHYVNILLFLFNVFLPMYPLDGGRMVQELLWAKIGYRKSMEISILVGFGAAIILGGVGIVFSEVILFAIAVFGALICWNERQRIRIGMLADSDQYGLWGGDGPTLDPDTEPDPAPSQRERKRQLKQEEKDQLDQEELDRILAKIASSGMDSLTRRERRILAGETKKRQNP